MAIADRTEAVRDCGFNAGQSIGMSASLRSGPASFAHAFDVQCRVIGALVLREMHTRYGRENIGYLWMVLEPMMLAGAVSAIHLGGGSHYGSDILPVPFTIVGYGVFMIFRGIFTRAEGALESNQPLLYHRMVTISDLLVSRAVLDGGSITITLAILMGLSTSLGLGNLPERPLYLLLAIFCMIWFSLGAGLLCCAATYENRLVARLVHPMTYLLMPICGAFYIVDWVPEPYRSWLWFLPLTQIFEMARYGQFESAKSDYFDILYILASCSVFTILGGLAVRVVRRHVHLS